MSMGTVNSIWRFYSDQHRLWRWQLLAFDQTVLESSAGGYEDYERCVSNAEEHGYRYSPAKSTRPAPGRKLKYSRRYAKVPTDPEEQAVSESRRDEPEAGSRDEPREPE